MPRRRRPALLSVDLPTRIHPHDSDLGGMRPLPRGEDLERQLRLALRALERREASATFFAAGKLLSVLRPGVWREIAVRHRVGCLGFEGRFVSTMTPELFQEDAAAGRRALQDAAATPVVSFRAPDFSAQGCESWFGRVLAETGYALDSSQPLTEPPEDFHGTLPLEGADEVVTEVPLMAVGVGSRAFPVIGGSQFRLLPLATIRLLLERAETLGFLPMVFLHPEDFDTAAAPAEPQGPFSWVGRAGDVVRRVGRATVEDKLHALSYRYRFVPIESALAQ